MFQHQMQLAQQRATMNKMPTLPQVRGNKANQRNNVEVISQGLASIESNGHKSPDISISDN